MAGGKMSARQKMINLMYLVFIAMLAMNMSKEVLSAFGFTNQKLEQNNRSTKRNLNLIYDNLNLKAIEKEKKYQPLKLIADKVRKTSDDFYVYLDTLKAQMIRGSEVDSINDFQAMDNGDWLDNHFFVGEEYKQEGTDFLNKINGFRDTLIAFAGGKYISSELLQNRFNTDSVNKGGKKYQKFLIARYFQFPMVASLTNFTQIQADIRNSENDIITNLLRGQLEIEGGIGNNYKGIVNLDKTAYFSGERVTGQVVLGRYDATLVPNKVILNGKEATNNVKDGQVIIDMPAGNVGEKSIKGTIYFTEKGESIPVDFESKYTVIAEPSSAVVSADKMNVVYRGLDNPISVSLPGVGANNISVSATGGKLSKNGAGYMMRPGAANTAVVNVSAKLSSGKTINDEATFRVKDIPAAMGSVRGQYGTVRMPKSGLANSPISAGLPDFMFDLKLQVNSFKIKVPGQLTIIVNGSKLNAAAKGKLAKAKRGDIINIYDIKASIIGNTYKLKQVLPVNIELTN
jgi:gliding motility-associated protein GldM